jgi:phosphoribosylanthranilate isomerase
MSVQIKFCGMMRTRDVEAALHNGASYVGAIMAGGPRSLSLRDAVATLAPAKGRAKRVVVVRPGRPEEVADVAREFDVVQLHGDASSEDIRSLRELYSGEIWTVVRVGEGGMPAASRDLFSLADAIVFDKQSANGLGGSGLRINWSSLSEQLGATRPRRMILAGGLNPSNVAEAISILRPDAVDVASGVEAAPGIKDHGLLREFFQAVRGAEGDL